ncbi:hypothetical protein, partial [Bradyrhizobium sp. Leo170]|uniref:hypothetical protein n=1 Tax=Bradyrhizobium sp. Leo170 TaxID=1571199 RepID=UPI001FDFE3C1
MSATQFALPCWSKVSVVRAPTLNEFQLRIACALVCWMPTWVWPLASTACVGAFAPCHPGAACRPPGASPFGT